MPRTSCLGRKFISVKVIVLRCDERCCCKCCERITVVPQAPHLMNPTATVWLAENWVYVWGLPGLGNILWDAWLCGNKHYKRNKWWWPQRRRVRYTHWPGVLYFWAFYLWWSSILLWERLLSVCDMSVNVSCTMWRLLVCSMEFRILM